MRKKHVSALANLSIRKKFSLILAIALFGFFFNCTAIIYIINSHFRHSLVSDLETLARQIGNGCQVSLEFGEQTTANEYLKSLQLRENIISATVYTKDGKKFASYFKDGALITPIPETYAYIKSVEWEDNVLKVSEDILLSGEKIGVVYLVSNLDALNATLSEILKLCGLVGSLTAFFAAFFSSKLQRLVSEPITILSDLSKQVSFEKDYSLRTPTVMQSTDEVGILATNFNEMLGVIQDRDQKLREAKDIAQAAMDKAQAATKAKSEFLANMSHEIRTPMNNVIGSLEMVFDFEPPMSEPQVECIKMAQASSETLLTVINDILDFSKIEAGKLVIDPASFNLREYLHQLTYTMFIRSQKKGIATSFEIADDVPETVHTDRTRVAQIVINLLANAMKFTDSGGSLGLRVSLRNSTVAESTKPIIEFQVWDSGIGIPKDKQSEIFKSFTQADASTTRKYGGTGLGLSIAHQLTVLLGGQMWVESEENVGSRFYFTIADYDAQTHDGRPIESRKPYSPFLAPNCVLSILVVDDNEMCRFLEEHRLKKFGHKVVIAVNGKEAVEKWQQGNFDLILMDCQMPIMDGFEATRRIRELEKSRPTKVAILAITANALEGDSNECTEAGMDGYISKPVVARELYEAIEKLLAKVHGH